MTKDQVASLIESLPQGLTVDELLVALATKAAEYERQAILQTIEELMGSDNRHPMFAEGYDYALRHIEEFVRGEKNRKVRM
jgi:hypothetical protein